MTAPERPVSEQAGVLANELQAVVNKMPRYSSQTPYLTAKAGISLSRMVERLAKQVEGLTDGA